MSKKYRLSFLVFVLIIGNLVARNWTFPNFVADTVTVEIAGDSLFTLSSFQFVRDYRSTSGRLIGIDTKKKWYYIPVDQHYMLKMPLADLCNWYFNDYLSPSQESHLIIDNLTYWVDRNTVFSKGAKLNGYSRLVDENGTIIKDWQWNIRSDTKGKLKPEERMGLLIKAWLDKQNQVLTNPVLDLRISPFSYRRQMTVWSDIVFLNDGYVVDIRLSLDFPVDEVDRYSRGIRGLYYRRSSIHESISFGGKDKQWYFRLNDRWQIRTGLTGRFGFNSIKTTEYEVVDWWNIFLVNFSGNASIEYRPRYYRGIFAGLGLYQLVNGLPELIDRFETGVLLTVGVNLP